MTDNDTVRLRLWAAVDLLTKPTTQKLTRTREANDWLTNLADQHAGWCDVPTYRAATITHGIIPSLWDQSTIALTGGEIGVGTGSKPLRERSIADLDLMEIRSLIRDTTRHELEKRGTKTQKHPTGTPVPFNQTEIRTLASLVTAKDPDDFWWWEYRFAQWGRLLATYLNAQERQVKPIHLRNTPCPTCRTRQVTIEQDGERLVVPALVVDFRDGYVRAATCQACSDTWFRGADLEALAALVRTQPDPDEKITA